MKTFMILIIRLKICFNKSLTQKIYKSEEFLWLLRAKDKKVINQFFRMFFICNNINFPHQRATSYIYSCTHAVHEKKKLAVCLSDG